MTRARWIGEFTDELLDRLPDARVRWRLHGTELVMRVKFAGVQAECAWPAHAQAGDPRHEAWELARHVLMSVDEADAEEADTGEKP